MARFVPHAERLPTPPDPLRGANDAIERLTTLVTTIAKLPPPQVHVPAQPAPVIPARPKTIEATITRDKAGKMQRIVLTPIY
jgi:hypothetical protein